MKGTEVPNPQRSSALVLCPDYFSPSRSEKYGLGMRLAVHVQGWRQQIEPGTAIVVGACVMNVCISTHKLGGSGGMPPPENF